MLQQEQKRKAEKQSSNESIIRHLEAEPFVCFDIGRALIHLMVGQFDRESKKIRTLSVGLAPSSGIQQGRIVDIKLLSDALRRAIDLAEQDLGLTLRTFYLGVDATLTHLKKVEAVRRFSGVDHRIERDDIERLMDELWSEDLDTLGQDGHGIDLFPVIYTLDQNRVTLNPLHLQSSLLGVKGFVLQRRDDTLLHMLRALRYAGAQVAGLLHIGLAVGEVFLTRDEKMQGAVILDLGAEGSKFYYFRSGFMQFDVYLPIGGELFTHDVEVVLRCRREEAEQLKFQYGFENDFTSSEEQDTDAMLDETATMVPQILRARLEQLINLARQEFSDRGVILDTLALKLLGGEIMVQGLEACLRRLWQGPVEQIDPGVSEVVLPTFTSTYAMVHYLEKLYVPGASDPDPSSWIDLGSEAISVSPASLASVAITQNSTQENATLESIQDETEDSKVYTESAEIDEGKIREKDEFRSREAERNRPSKTRNEGWRSWFRLP